MEGSAWFRSKAAALRQSSAFFSLPPNARTLMMASTAATIRRAAAGSSDAIPQPANSAMAGPADAKYRGERNLTGVSADTRNRVTTGIISQPASSTNVDDRA